LICYATRGKHTFNFPKEGHALSTWTINKRNGDTGHPTEKPVEVPATAVSHSSKEKDVVLDLFGGSGSTLIACEQLNRKCYMCELDPNYIDVIIDRWERFTGEKAVKIGGEV
jgi:DNA modification methylase